MEKVETLKQFEQKFPASAVPPMTVWNIDAKGCLYATRIGPPCLCIGWRFANVLVVPKTIAMYALSLPKIVATLFDFFSSFPVKHERSRRKDEQ